MPTEGSGPISIQIFFQLDDYHSATQHLAHHPTRHRPSSEPIYNDCYAFRRHPGLGQSLVIGLKPDRRGVVVHYHALPAETAQLGWQLLQEIGAYNVIDEFTALEEGDYWREYPIRR